MDTFCLPTVKLSARTTLFLITSSRFCYGFYPADELTACAMALLAFSLSTSELFLICTYGFELSGGPLLFLRWSTVASSFSHFFKSLPFSIICLSSSSLFSLRTYSSSLTSYSCSFLIFSSSFSKSECLRWVCSLRLSNSFYNDPTSVLDSSKRVLSTAFSFSFCSLAILIDSISVSRCSKSSLCFNISYRFSRIKVSTCYLIISTSDSTLAFSF